MIIIAYVIEDEVINQRLLLEAKYLQTEYKADPKASPRGKHFKLYFSVNELPELLKEQIHDKNYDREISIRKTIIITISISRSTKKPIWL